MILFQVFLIIIASSVNLASQIFQDVDSYISNLNYSKEQFLKYKGSPIQKPVVESIIEDNRFIVWNQPIKSKSSFIYQILVDDASDTVVFPGSLMSAKGLLLNEKPHVFEFPRKSLQYSITRLPMQRPTFVANFSVLPTYFNYKSALDGVLAKFYEKYENPGHFQITDSQMVYSRDQMIVELGIQDADRLNIDFKAVENNETLVRVDYFEHTSYEVGTDWFPRVSDLFDESVTSEELSYKGVNSSNPPIIVDHVYYGRLFYVVLTTTSIDDEAFNILLNNKEHLYHQLENFQIRVPFVRGGCEEFRSELLAAEDLTSIRMILKDYWELNHLNPPAPIRFQSHFIKDNTSVTIEASTEFLGRRSVQFYENVIQLIHHQNYIVRLFVDWKQITYDKDGRRFVTDEGWDKNGQFHNSLSEQIWLNERAVDITIWAQVCYKPRDQDCELIYEQRYLPPLKFRQIEFKSRNEKPYVQIEESTSVQRIREAFSGSTQPIFLSTTEAYTTKKVFEGGIIQLTHHEDYAVKLFVKWEEIFYDGKGNAFLRVKSWDKNGLELDSISEWIQLGRNVSHLEFKAWACTGFFWWKNCEKIYDQENLPLVKFREIRFAKDSGKPIILGSPLKSSCNINSFHPLLGYLIVFLIYSINTAK